MHAIILAAGMGTRLGASVPKPLVEIAPGRTLLDHQLFLLSRFVTLDRVIVVVGHESSLLISRLPHIRHAINRRYASTNTAASLRVGLEHVEGDDALWLNGDLYLERSAVECLLAAASGEGAALVDRAAAAGEESMKVRIDGQGLVVEISKDAQGSSGESLGMHFAPRRDVPHLLAALARCRDDEYFEAALMRCIGAGTMVIRPIGVPAGSYCREVDFPEDLEAVRRRVAMVGIA